LPASADWRECREVCSLGGLSVAHSRDLGHAEGTPPLKRSRQQRSPWPLAWGFFMERVTRIELAL